ncbi:MATE efflux family protein [Boletus reticuloceps]|uniref:MATE efflux family protein n=1 Tax=Boletus reticuloceps TaxID=495285 RepID=A0A8I2Z0M2_9AGAM|nr:MATE efflux family protein [Boletus reticuloceps]
MTDTDIFATSVSDRQDTEREDECRADRKNEQLSIWSSVPSMIKHFFTLPFLPKGGKTKFVDPGLQVLPSETTALLASPIPRIEQPVNHESSGSNAFFSVFQQEAKTLIRYALPVFGTHLFEHSIIMSSVISIGHISTTALAAATIGFMTANVTGLSVIQGMSSALDTVLPSAWTSNQPQLVGLWTQRMVVLQIIILIPIYMVWFNAEGLLLALRQDPEVARYASIYLKWASLSLPAYSFNCISRRYFQAQGLFDVPARIILFVAPINILLSYTLVWGPDPIRLGFIGAPIATSISYNLISVASVFYGIFFVKRTAWHPISSRCLTSLGTLARLSMGGVGQVVSEWWSWELVGLAASFLGPIPLATQSVLLSTVSSTFQVPYALGIATSVRIGNLLGEKNANRAGVAASASMFICICLALLLSGVLVAFRATWGYMFNGDPAVVALVAAMLPLVALAQFFDQCGAVLSGILRSRGKQTLGALINISAFYCIGTPVSLWLTFKQNWGLSGLWWGLTIGMAWAVILGSYFCMLTDWENEVERVMARLAVDKGYEQERRDEEYVYAGGCDGS